MTSQATQYYDCVGFGVSDHPGYWKTSQVISMRGAMIPSTNGTMWWAMAIILR
ncbi:hypothetical protein [Microvirga sp. TS319]|uniref:hypothetical protein n=1 Tax=Microvirga sp. TS319 TaxID=3241165 RepID=UPI00351A6E51